MFESLRRERQRHRGEQTTLERCQVRGKDDAIGQAQDLLDFGRVAMLPTPYASKFSSALQKCVRALQDLPAPVTPLMASTITGPFSATQPARTAGAAARLVAVG